MKKFLSRGLVVLMVLVAFASCDNTPVYPGYIVSGSIAQTGDFLSGQSFDPGKFTVTAYDLNGKAIAVDSSNVTLDETSKGEVKAGSTVNVIYGYDMYGNPIEDSMTVDVSYIRYLEVTGPESVVNKEKITASELTVTAYYLDSDNVEQSMVLVPGEYSVEEGTQVDVTPANPTAIESLTVSAEVGNFDDAKPVSVSYSYTVQYEETPAKPDASITGIAMNEEGTAPLVFSYSNRDLYEWEYTSVPAPSLSNITISVTKNDNTTENVTADRLADATARFIDSTTRLPYAELNPKTDDSVFVELTYDGDVYVSTSSLAKPAKVTLHIAPNRGFSLTEGSAIGTPSLSDFSVYYTTGSSSIGTAVTDIELAYVDDEGNVIPADTEVTTDTEAFVAGKFRGVPGKTEGALDVDPVTVVPVSITDIVLDEKFEAPESQYYDESAWADATAVESTAVASYTIVMSNGDEIASTDTDALTAAGLSDITLSVAYTLSESSAQSAALPSEAIAENDLGYNAAYATEENGSYFDVLAGIDEIYLQVSFKFKSGDETGDETVVYGYAPVELATAYASSIDVSKAYQYYTGDDATTSPMFGSEVYVTVRTLNANGVVNPDLEDYEALNASNVPAEIPATVGDKEATYTVYAYLADENGIETMAEPVELTIDAGQDWIDVSRLSIGLALDEDGETVIPAMIGTSVSDYNTDNGFNITGWTHAIEDGEAAEPVIELQIPDSQVFTATTAIRATVTYVDETGKEVTENVSFNITGTAWTEDADSASLTWGTGNNARTEVAEGNLYVGISYAFGSFDIADVIEHGNDSELDIQFYTISTDEEGEDGLPHHTQSITAEADTTYTFYISYTDSEGVVHDTVNGATAMATVELSSTAAPEEPGN